MARQGSKLIFTTEGGTPIEPRNVNRSGDPRCAKAGVRKITVHDAPHLRNAAGGLRRASCPLDTLTCEKSTMLGQAL